MPGPSNCFIVRDFSWTSKLVLSPDCSSSSLQPIVQVHLYCEGSETAPSQPLVFEFTPKELESFLNQFIMSRLYPNLPPGYIWKSTIKILLGSGIVYTGAELYCGSENFYKNVIRVLHKYVDGEQSHQLAVKMAQYNLLPRSGDNLKEYESLKTTVFGRVFNNPVGIAAGFDKDGEAIENLRNCGVGFLEIGSVTPRPQPGNPKPRVFRLSEDQAVINRYGFNSQGCGRVSARVKQSYDPTHPVLFGVNLGKNKTTEYAAGDYEIGIGSFGPYCDYLVINVSSPNTPGLRNLQNKKELSKVLKIVREAVDREEMEFGRRPKLLLKIAPDLTFRDMADISKLILDKFYGIDGLIVSNTTIQRPKTLKSPYKNEIGGLSGQPLKDLSTHAISEMYRHTGGKIPIIGCGGIFNGKDAYEKIRAGASLVQLYTAMVYEGFPVIGKVKRELDECLRKDGFHKIEEAVGADNPQVKNKKYWFW
uniref:Dihydroorotate dehydrogenase (quinone), mitochondrial n=1 Tax=Panagrolaimus sp. JU765 TaxID=591449 RepID=A0AC34RAA1_9BILA